MEKDEFDEMIESLDKASDSLDETVELLEEASNSLDEAIKSVEKCKESLQKLTNIYQTYIDSNRRFRYRVLIFFILSIIIIFTSLFKLMSIY